MNIVAVPDKQGEIRLDSRALAERMGNQHASIMKLVNENQGHFEGFGQVRFEIGTVKNSVGAVNKSRFALLNEDQCYFLLTLVRNSEVTVPMKAAVVAAFAAARQLLVAAQPLPTTAPALVSARLVGEALGCSPKSALNRLSHANIRATHHFFEPICGAPALLYPLEAAQTRWPAANFDVFQGQAYVGTAPVASAITGSTNGKTARRHHPRLIPTDNSVEQLARRLLSLEAQKKAVLKELAAIGGLA